MSLIGDIQNFKFDNNCKVSLQIFDWLQTSSGEEYKEVADTIAEIYPTASYVRKRPHMSHTPYALFIRHLFSVKHKNGTLISQWHPDRKSELKSNIDACKHWNKSFDFVEELNKSFQSIKNTYGRVILYEVWAHRYGDLAVLGVDKQRNIDQMKDLYKKSFSLAEDIGCKKQEFTPWYWGACYFSKLDMNKETVAWFRQFHKRCNSMAGRSSYVNKAKLSIQLVKNALSKKEFTEYLIWLKKKSKSPAIKKALLRMKL